MLGTISSTLTAPVLGVRYELFNKKLVQTHSSLLLANAMGRWVVFCEDGNLIRVPSFDRERLDRRCQLLPFDSLINVNERFYGGRTTGSQNQTFASILKNKKMTTLIKVLPTFSMMGNRFLTVLM
jgi:hypothetical protein